MQLEFVLSILCEITPPLFYMLQHLSLFQNDHLSNREWSEVDAVSQATPSQTEVQSQRSRYLNVKLAPAYTSSMGQISNDSGGNYQDSHYNELLLTDKFIVPE